jgi:hypothetical protein
MMCTARSLTLRVFTLGVAFSLSCAGMAAAQTSRPATKSAVWEVEFHGGFGTSSSPQNGTGQLPPAGEVFLSGSQAAQSRAISSWYFGDGALLFNQFRAFFPYIPAIVPLDDALQRQGARQRAGGALGVRVSRTVGTHYSAEFNLEFLPGKLELTDSLKAGAETSRASFLDTFRTLWADGPGVAVHSVSAIADAGGNRVQTSGVVNIHLKTRGGLLPHLTIGGGIESARGDQPAVTLTGDYSFGVGGTTIHETDSVTVRAHARTAFFAVVGAGFKKPFRRRSGFRADVRMLLGNNPLSVVLDATPSASPFSPGLTVRSASNPAIVFSSVPALQRSLSGPALESFQTFSGGGTRIEVIATAGYFFRFR